MNTVYSFNNSIHYIMNIYITKDIRVQWSHSPDKLYINQVCCIYIGGREKTFLMNAFMQNLCPEFVNEKNVEFFFENHFGIESR